MEPAAISPLAAWESFYVIIGSSAAALTGLQFVVIVLAADMDAVGDPTVTRAFATPTIVHFCGVLLMSAILSAPWRALWSAGIALGLCGVAGTIYVLNVIRHARRQKHYVAVLEDWLWHCVFPLIAYIAILAAAIALRQNPVPSLFVIGTAAVFLLFIGIHNAWDAVVYIALKRRQTAKTDNDKI
jgi:hypothetical protein